MLGHKSAKVTLDTYADLFDDDLDAVAVTLHARYSQQNVGNMWAKTGSPDGEKDEKNSSPATTGEKPWRWRRDLNPRTGVTRHTLSRRAP
jgi:hypothetical protein